MRRWSSVAKKSAPRNHAAAETPRGEPSRNETGASRRFRFRFSQTPSASSSSLSSQKEKSSHLQTRTPPPASTETTAPVSSHARTSVTTSPSTCPRNADERAKTFLFRDASSSRQDVVLSDAARSTSLTSAPASGDASTTRSGGGSPRGFKRSRCDSGRCVGRFAATSPRRVRLGAQVAEKYAGWLAAASRCAHVASSSSIGARRQRCARGTRADALESVSSNPSSIHTHTAPSDPSAARKSAPSRAGTAAAQNASKVFFVAVFPASSSRVSNSNSFRELSGGGG